MIQKVRSLTSYNRACVKRSFLNAHLIYPGQSRKPHTFGSLTNSHFQNSSMPPLRELPDKTTLISEPSVFDCKPLHLVRPFPQRMKSWPIYRQGQPSFDE